MKNQIKKFISYYEDELIIAAAILTVIIPLIFAGMACGC